MKCKAWKYLFRDVWWRCAHYFVIASYGYILVDNRAMYIIFLPVVVTVWGSVGMFVV